MKKFYRKRSPREFSDELYNNVFRNELNNLWREFSFSPLLLGYAAFVFSVFLMDILFFRLEE
jgi:hypothetical protein